MTLGEKIRQLRKQRDWTQDELGKRVGVHGRHVTRWEKNKMAPSAKTLGRLADVFQVSLDELAQENNGALPESLVTDSELLAQFQVVSHFEEEDKKAIKRILQAMIREHQVKNIVA